MDTGAAWAKESVWASLQAAIVYLWTDKLLRFIFIILIAINFLLIGLIMIGIPVLVAQRLPEGATANVSLIAATMNLQAVFTMMFAFIFMRQRLTTTPTIGVLMIISGAALASIDWGSIRNQRFQLSLGVKEAISGLSSLEFFGISGRLFLNRSGGYSRLYL